MAEIVKQEGNKVQFKVNVPAGEVTRAYQQVFTALARDVRVPGFRPGKAPRRVLESRVGSGYVQSEVRDRVLNTAYPQALRELNLNLVDAQIDPSELKEGQGFDFTVNGETYPKVTLADWSSVTLNAAAPEITDEMLDQTLTDLRERNATFEDADRPIEAGDMVNVQEEGEDSAYPVYLDVAEPHVRDALVGKSKGDVVQISVPAHSHGDHEHPEHTVTVTVQDVRFKKLQELDDEFAKSLNFDSLERLKTDLKGELERRAASEGETARREELVKALVDGMQVEIPQVMLDNRRDAMMSEIKEDLSRQGVKWDEYEGFMQEQGKLDDFMADLSRNAETRVRRDLALEQLAEDLKVRLSDREFNQALLNLAQGNNVTVQELQRQLGQNGLTGYYASLVRDRALATAIAQLSAPASSETEPVEATAESDPADTAEAGTAEADQAGASTEESADVQQSDSQ